MSKRDKYIRSLYEQENWQGIVDSYHDKNPLGLESAEICKLFVNALRRKGFFIEANSLEHSISEISEKPRLTHIVRLIFDHDFNHKYDVNGVVEYFVNCLSKSHTQAWAEFIKLLAKDASLNEFKEYQDRFNFSRQNPTQHKKIFIAGFGRSGTGALRALLNEFKEVYEVPGSEITIISGRRSLSSLFHSHSLSVFKEKFLEFFALHALSVSEVNNHADNKELQKSKIIIAKTEEVKLLKAFFYFYMDVVFSSPFSSNSVEKSSQDFLNRYIDSLIKPKGKEVILFNNVVNAHKLWMMRLVDNYLCFPVSRDPRSQYASYISTWRPDFSVTGFIKQFEKGEKLYNDGVNSLSEGRENIIRVFFEDIVCSENERLKIVDLAGLKKENASRFTLLKPEESISNVLLHESNEFMHCKEDFELIASLLGEYCLAFDANIY
ncbi:hypothetical protein [Vreelandella sp. GE22]